VVAIGRDGVTLAESSVPSADVTDELRRYPADPAVAPLDVDRATATIRLRMVAQSANTLEAPDSAVTRLGIDRGVERLTGLLRAGWTGDVAALLAALLAAAFLGAVHALGPGHGKSIAGAYLVGSRGTAWHALLLGGTVTATHTAGVYALGTLTLVAAPYVLPERLYPILGALSGVLVVVIGLRLAWSRLRALRAHAPAVEGRHRLDETHHGHDHPHVASGASWRPVMALGVSGGLLPCPTALVVLLAAVSFHNVALGLALVAAFSAGLAAVLTGIGLLMVGGGRALARSGAARRMRSSAAIRIIPALSALAVAVAGLVIALGALRALA
jgi:ABC-type nickel/cobalt efflux system permease component RcnA